MRDEVDGLGRSAHEDDLVGRRADEPRGLEARGVVELRRLLAEGVHAAVHVRGAALVVVDDGVDDGARLGGRRRAVEEGERLPVERAREHGKLRAKALGERVDGVVDRAAASAHRVRPRRRARPRSSGKCRLLTRNLPLGSMGIAVADRTDERRAPRAAAPGARARLVHDARARPPLGDDVDLDARPACAGSTCQRRQPVDGPERAVDRARGHERAVGPHERVVHAPLDAVQRRHGGPSPRSAVQSTCTRSPTTNRTSGMRHAVERRHHHERHVLRARRRHARRAGAPRAS